MEKCPGGNNLDKLKIGNTGHRYVLNGTPFSNNDSPTFRDKDLGRRTSQESRNYNTLLLNITIFAKVLS